MTLAPGGKKIKGIKIHLAVDTRRAAKLITVSRWRSTSRRRMSLGRGNAVRRYSKGIVPTGCQQQTSSRVEQNERFRSIAKAHDWAGGTANQALSRARQSAPAGFWNRSNAIRSGP
jgi:hypothetical protein